jgi:hypothetical protein
MITATVSAKWSLSATIERRWKMLNPKFTKHQHGWHPREKKANGYIIKGYVCACGAKRYTDMIKDTSHASASTEGREGPV